MTDASQLLKELIDIAALPKAELARRLGVSPQAVTNWTTGQARPSKANLTRLEEELDAQPPGALLHAFGYATGECRQSETSIEDAIRADRRISPEDKRVLLAIVSRFVEGR
jgi:transcriptional regulator with XRE-family HTH domain